MNLAIIGFGNIAGKHVAAIENIDAINLVAISDPSNNINVPEGVAHYKTAEAMLIDHKNLDIVSVCTPNAYHEKFSIAAMEAGCNVICEKPLSLTVDSCRRILDAEKRTGKKAVCVMQNRYSPVSQWMKELIDNKSLGKIFMVNVSCYWNRNAEYYKSSDWRGDLNMDGGTLFTQFSHYVDTLYWLFGGIKVKHALFNNFNHGASIDFEDSGIFSFETENGAMGSFNYTTACYKENFESTFTIIGEKGTIEIAGQYMDTLRYCNIEGMTIPELKKGDNIQHLKAVYLSAINSFQGLNHQSTNLGDGTEVVGIIESVYAFKKK